MLDGIGREPAAQAGMVVAEGGFVQVAIPVQLVAFSHALEAKTVLGKAIGIKTKFCFWQFQNFEINRNS